MRHLWETMSGSGDSGTGTKPTPCHIHTHPTTSHTPHAQQAPRPRIRTTHALKAQTTSPKTPHIRSMSPKWSALWAHPSPTPPMWKQQQGLRGLPQCPWATEPGQTSETTHQTTRQQPAPPAWRAPEGPEGLAAVPVGSGRAWPDNEPTRRAKRGRLASRAAGPSGARNTRGA